MTKQRPCVALALAAAWLMGCGKKSPSETSYLLVAKDLTLVGAVVTAGGKRATFAKAPWNASEQVARATLVFPHEAPMLLSELKLELRTPCGAKLVPLKVKQTAADEQKARESSVFYIDVEPANLTGGVDVWVDAKAGHKVEIGGVELTPPQVRLYEVGCGAGAVSVDGKPAGTLPADLAARKKALFVAADPAACYSYEHVGYGAGQGSRPQVLRGKNVYEVDEGPIEYFLTKAPTSKSVSKYSNSAYVTELVSVPCP